MNQSPIKPVHAGSGEAVSRDSILFLSFKISRDSSAGISEVELMKRKVVAGKIKKNKHIHADFKSALEMQFCDKKGNVIASQIIEHPLFKNIEYLNERNEYQMKFVVLKEAEFFIREQKASEYWQIKIRESLNNSGFREIGKFLL